jgi:dimethylglycine dehydrogenase
LTPMLTPKGKLYGDLTVAKMGDESFLLFGSGAAQEMHRRWFEMHMPEAGVVYRNRTDELHGFAISGPKSRALLSRLTREDMTNTAFKFRDIRNMVVADVPAIVARVSFTGELGYEIYCEHQFHMRLFEALAAAGGDLGLKLYGGRALMSMRFEKNWGVWTMDYRPDFTAAESGLDAFVAFGKAADFIGKTAAKADRPAKKLVTMVVETKDVDCLGDEPIFHGGKCVGYVSSGGYAHHVKKSMAMGYVPTACAADGTELEIELLGDFYKARVVAKPVYDPAGSRMRS